MFSKLLMFIKFAQLNSNEALSSCRKFASEVLL